MNKKTLGIVLVTALVTVGCSDPAQQTEAASSPASEISPVAVASAAAETPPTTPSPLQQVDGSAAQEKTDPAGCPFLSNEKIAAIPVSQRDRYQLVRAQKDACDWEAEGTLRGMSASVLSWWTKNKFDSFKANHAADTRIEDNDAVGTDGFFYYQVSDDPHPTQYFTFVDAGFLSVGGNGVFANKPALIAAAKEVAERIGTVPDDFEE